MRRLFILLFIGLTSLASAYSQAVDYSYIRMKTFTARDASSSQDRIDYDNGLGDPYQQVLAGVTPTGKSLVTMNEYDTHRRPLRRWLPALSVNGTSCMDTTALKSSSRQMAGGDVCPYITNIYEPSPLDRVRKVYNPGADWYVKSKSIRTYRSINLGNAGSDFQMLNFIILYSDMLSKEWVKAATDLVTETTDEDGNRLLEFYDMEGNLRLSRRIADGRSYSTYYVRDDAGRLRYVFPPAIEEYLEQLGNGPMSTGTEQMLRYVTVYRYDGLGNCTYRRQPGCEPDYYIYDKGGRLIFSQSGVQRGRGEWTFTIPDALGRATLSGICNNTLSYAAEPLRGITVSASRSTASGNIYGYSISGISLSSPIIHNVGYYDDYSFIGTGSVPTSLTYTAPPSGYGSRYTGGSRGLMTGKITARLGTGVVTGYDYSAIYYDDCGRTIQNRQTNHLGGSEIQYLSYNFTGQLLKCMHVHSAEGKTTQTEILSNEYDHAGRLTRTGHKLNTGTEVTLAANTYDELGRLATRTLHASTSNRLTYAYNLRGWLTGISGTKLTQNLYYNTGVGTPRYNGNISSMTWKAGDEGTVRGYKFTYDALDRMRNAEYGETAGINTNLNRFSETVTLYDRNGNISALQRYGQTSPSGYGLTDSLTYTYAGNQLSRVDDAAGDAAYDNGFEFKDAASQEREYAYDANGNLTKDLNKSITGISYNILNLPDAISFSDGSTISYTYGADGTKLRTVHKIGSTTTTKDYCGNIIYEDGVQKQLLTGEGYVSLSDSRYHYYMKDHQGNNRVVTDQNGNVEETNHYYPFGGVFACSNNVQPYKYNGKELDTKKGLNWYDYGARFYDPALGRWHSVDPLAEKHYLISPYVYCGNNPVNRIDPDGREWKENKDEEIAKQLQQQISSRDKSLVKQEQKINAQIDRIANNIKLSTEKRDQQIAKQQGKLEDVQIQRTQLSNLDKGITQLGDSKTSYTFNTVEAGTTSTLSSMSDGTVVINNYGTTGNRAHETTHAIQYDNGQIKFNPLGSNNTLMQNPMGLEIQAYATEYSITNGIVPSSDARYPRTIFGITPQWLYGLKDPNTGIYIYRPENYK